MRKTVAVAEDDVRCALRAMDADVQAALALNRATLHALAALSPVMNTAVEAALEDEVERAAARAAPQRTLDVVDDARARVRQAPQEAQMARVLQRALVDAADSLAPIGSPARADRAA